MDIPCKVCGEPLDNDELHEEVAAREAAGIAATYDLVAAEFRKIGCKALTETYGNAVCEPANTVRTEAFAVMYELLGDDMDGAAAMFEDAEYMGMLD